MLRVLFVEISERMIPRQFVVEQYDFKYQLSSRNRAIPSVHAKDSVYLVEHERNEPCRFIFVCLFFNSHNEKER